MKTSFAQRILGKFGRKGRRIFCGPGLLKQTECREHLPALRILDPCGLTADGGANRLRPRAGLVPRADPAEHIVRRLSRVCPLVLGDIRRL